VFPGVCIQMLCTISDIGLCARLLALVDIFRVNRWCKLRTCGSLLRVKYECLFAGVIPLFIARAESFECTNVIYLHVSLTLALLTLKIK
jgi:hypothetical protein